ncbi:uncharacterized protein haspin [Cololabis saira]|uniref:uncharacterized protein haspin n=1 Tax=Cololabis saira TaxID=129043 RepID=UPI002AD1DD06|nr:uncharacterized protein haspin [Cololabis saira]
MKRHKPLFLKTYGKQRRKISAWVLPDDRNQYFDSTSSSDDLAEPENPRRTRGKYTGVHRDMRPAKKKAFLHLIESSDEENMSDEEKVTALSTSSPLRGHQTKTSRGKRTSVCKGKPINPGKRKAVLRPVEISSNEDNITRPSSPPSKRRMTTRRSRLVSAPVPTKPRTHKPSVTTDSEEERSASRRPKNSVKMKPDSNVQFASAGRFVTRRKCAASNKLSKAIASLLSSSDDFTSGAFGPGRSLRSRRRKAPPAFGLSSAESSVTAAGTTGFAAKPFREFSLNESADRSLGPCSRKPIFCSTPSAGALSKREQAKRRPTHDQVASPPSLSVSCIGASSTFQESSDSPRQAAFPPQSAAAGGAPGLLHREEQSVDLFMEPSGGSCGEEPKIQSGNSKRSDGGAVPSENVLSVNDESSIRFVSAAGGSEWLIDVLKEKCLNQRCSVQMTRLDFFTVAQLCSQTTFSSCLEDSGSAHSRQTEEQPQPAGGGSAVRGLHSSEESLIHHHSSGETNKTGDWSKSLTDCEQSASLAESLRANSLSSADCKELESVIYIDSVHHTDRSCEGILAEEAGRERTCSVQLQKLTLSQIKAEKLQKLPHGNSPEAKTESTDSGDRSKLELMLKEKCLTKRPFVQVKRSSPSLMKELRNLRDAMLDSSTDVSDSSSNEETKTDHPSESDSRENSPTVKAGVQTRRTTLEGKTSSGAAADKNLRRAAPKRKKAALASKNKRRRSTSVDRPGGTRKACVSGLSVSRWKNRGDTSTFGSRTAQWGFTKDCSITELISTHHKQPQEPLTATTMNFSTPARASRLNLSSLLAELTPRTHTWSRLKAALSVHRKGMVQLTPRNLPVTAKGSPQRTALVDLSTDLFATPLRTPLSRRLQSQLQSQGSQSVCEDADLSDAEKVFSECGQQQPLAWDACILPVRMKRCAKIGEGTFGEVFSTTNASGDTVALKIIPIEGDEKVNGEEQKTFGEILHEIIISKELSSLKEKQHNQTHGFIGLNDLHCVQGCYPPEFLKAWDAFDQRKGSENDRPDFFEKTQLFLILEFEFGGTDLENSNGTLASLGVAKSILHQVTAALAVAEQELHFEHRDLHWGNVLVKTTRQRTGSFLLNGAAHSVETKGVLVRIIDYSLSRLEIDELTVSCDISNDEELFMGQGDYQFDIYRLMRQENGNDWNSYHPHTNVLWLRYLCSKLLSMKYRSGRGVKDVRGELTRFHDDVLEYGSATEALRNCPMFQ